MDIRQATVSIVDSLSCLPGSLIAFCSPCTIGRRSAGYAKCQHPQLARKLHVQVLWVISYHLVRFVCPDDNLCFPRPVSCFDMARAIICCSQPQRRDRRVHSREDVSTTTSSDGAHLTEGFTAIANRDEEAVDTPSGHVTSISVLRPYRRLGLANKLMRQSRKLCSINDPLPCPARSYLTALGLAEKSMATLYNAAHITLHVRKSNRAAISLYRDSLGFEVTGVEKAYCE